MIKRLIDIVLSLIGLVLLSPVFLIVYCLVRLKLGNPVFFKQQRPGRFSKPFELIKFRTMLDLKNAEGHTLPDGERLGPFGRKLRVTSLDELPELWNVLKGDMSLVGPRPLLMEYFPLYSKEQRRRMNVRPGLTGWAQVNGRNALSWEQKFDLDVWYVDNQSTLLDIKIIIMTIFKVLSREGIAAQDNVTMPKFKGSKIAADKEDC